VRERRADELDAIRGEARDAIAGLHTSRAQRGR
jgi:hypothetical protein